MLLLDRTMFGVTRWWNRSFSVRRFTGCSKKFAMESIGTVRSKRGLLLYSRADLSLSRVRRLCARAQEPLSHLGVPAPARPKKIASVSKRVMPKLDQARRNPGWPSSAAIRARRSYRSNRANCSAKTAGRCCGLEDAALAVLARRPEHPSPARRNSPPPLSCFHVWISSRTRRIFGTPSVASDRHRKSLRAIATRFAYALQIDLRLGDALGELKANVICPLPGDCNRQTLDGFAKRNIRRDRSCQAMTQCIFRNTGFSGRRFRPSAETRIASICERAR